MPEPQHYQREAQRLLLDNERQRRELAILRQDLASALTMYVRASIIVQRLDEKQRQPIDASAEDLGRVEIDLADAIANWKNSPLGSRQEILDRITALTRAIPDGR